MQSVRKLVESESQYVSVDYCLTRVDRNLSGIDYLMSHLHVSETAAFLAP